ncbi:MAG: hypothetical protein RL748_2011 [Pseudomonadota bacterium]
MVLSVKMTTILAQQFTSQRLDAALFMELFANWKSSGPAGDDNFYEFGKDGAYSRPLVNNQAYVLRHVHLLPVVDMQKRLEWDRRWRNYSRRTSDRVLVYVDDGPKRFLLIAILPEPEAHNIARMATQRDQDVMQSFSAIAEEFIFSGKIIA